MRPVWLLDRYLLGRSNPASGVSFEEALSLAECDTATFDFDPRSRTMSDDLPDVSGRPVLAYGSFAFVKHVLDLSKTLKPCPGAYTRIENHSFHRFAAHLGDLLLNDDFSILPFGELLRRPAPTTSVFIRPDRVTKSFTGFAVGPEAFSHEVSSLSRVLNVGREELVVLSSAKEIDLECRYVIADRQVVSGSTYGWDENFAHTDLTDPRCDEIAREVAGREWQPDTVYTCDIALCGGEGRVVELNTFSCSGLYACDTQAVARAVTKCMTDEFEGN